MALVVDAAVCARRLKALYAAWRADAAGWAGVTCVAVPRGPAAADADELRYLKSVALHIWLFGYEVPDTLLLFTPDALHVVASPKKAEILRPVVAPAKAEANIDVVFHEKPKGADGGEQADALLAMARALGAPMGVLAREKPDGGLCTVWHARAAAAGLEQADVAPALARLMAPKDEAELTAIKRAAHLSATVLEKFVVAKIESVVDEEGKIKHSALAEKAMDAAAEPAKEPLGVRLKPENVEICYPFIVQSGGEYDLRWSAGSNDKPLAYEPTGVIVCQLGCRYKWYCSNVGRTYLIDPPRGVSDAYTALLAAHAAATAALREGARCSDVHAAAAAALAAAPGGAALVPHLTKALGAATGLEFREAALLLSPKCDARIPAGAVFNLATGLAELVNTAAAEGSRERVYALLLADTVAVTAGGAPPEVLTSAKSALTDISYEINEQEPEEADAAPARPARAAGGNTVLDARMRSGAAGPTAEARRKAQQEELAAQKNAETLRRLTEANRRNAAAASSSGAAQDFVAYRSPADVPSDRAREALIVVDRAKEAVLLPIYGQLVPFHIGTIKNCSATQEGVAHFIRIHFNVPGSAFGGAGYAPGAAHPDATFLREVTFRSADGRHASNVVSEIKTLRTAAKQRANEAAERATLVRQDKLQLAKGRVHRLADVWVRPAFGGRGRKLSGTLECHANGFRYSTPKSEERLDIIFSNIKHAFYQPSEKELITVLHFHLHEPIMVGKKKTHDVQVFAEVMDAVQSLDGGRRSMYDPDEIEDEQRERERRNRVNADFQAFTKRVQEVWEKDFADLDLEFEIPFRELAFSGVPYKTSSTVFPTVKSLVDLIETPFLVLTLKEIEVVNLERVGFALKNFDMAIVFRDFTREVHRIDAIDTKHLETIKEWLNSLGVKYYESKMNLNWKPILKTILDDPAKFVEEGGWDFLDLEKSDDEDEDEEESDGYVPTDGEGSGGEEEEEASSEEESVAESDEEGSDFEEEEPEEAGKDWDELEAEAQRADKSTYDEAPSDDDRKRKGGGKGAKPAAKKSKY